MPRLILLDLMDAIKASYLYVAILFFAGVAFVLAISMLVIVIRKNRRVKKRKQLAADMENWLMEIILDGDAVEGGQFAIPAEIASLLQEPLARKVLLREMVKVKRSLSGMSADNIEKLYAQCDLLQLSQQRVGHRKWHIRAKGIQELALMSRHEVHAQLFQLSNDKDMMVRMEAQSALVRLKHYEGLAFLDQLSYAISEWHQLNLLHLVGTQPLPANQSLLPWLGSSNDSVVQFTLKLIEAQHAFEYYDAVLDCLGHQRAVIRRQAVQCLGEISAGDANALLCSHYGSEPEAEVKMSILEALRKTGGPEEVDFLDSLSEETDPSLKLAANKTSLYLQKKFNLVNSRHPQPALAGHADVETGFIRSV